MPKNRDLKRRANPRSSTSPRDKANADADRSPAKGMSAPAFAGGIIAIVVALVCAGALALTQFEAFTLPGCGANSGCAGAAASEFGKVPVPGLDEPWSVSFLGVAYFAAVGLAWLISRRGVSAALKAVLVLGAFGSLFWTTVMIARPDELFCPYCLGTHLANFALVGIALLAGGSARNSRAALAAVAVGFVAATGAIAGVDQWSTARAMETAEQEAAESIEALKQRSREQADAQALEQSPAQADAGATNTNAGPDTTADTSTPDEPAQPSWRTADYEMWNGLKAYEQDWPDRGFTGNYLLGEPDAPIRVVVFSSYQCKDCARVEKEVMDLVRERDDVSFSHMHFPFAHPCNPKIDPDKPLHSNSCWAARAAEIAGYLYGPSGFWTMHDWLFSRGGGFTGPELRQFLQQQPGWDAQRFLSLMEDERFVDIVKQDVQTAIDLGIMYTPMMWVNGVQIRGFRIHNVLSRAVRQLAETDPPRATAAADTPPPAFDKLVADWEHATATVQLGRDAFVARTGPERADIRITAFLGYGHEMAANLDRHIKEVMEGRDDISYTVRFYPLGPECNPAVQALDIPGACHMTAVAEAAGRLHGADAFFDVHDWIMANYDRYDEARFHDALVEMGYDLDPLLAEAESSAVLDALAAEGSLLRRIGKPSYALLVVNDKIAPRWLLDDGQNVVQGIVDLLDSKSGGG